MLVRDLLETWNQIREAEADPEARKFLLKTWIEVLESQALAERLLPTEETSGN